jgi:hypothetical protein
MRLGKKYFHNISPHFHTRHRQWTRQFARWTCGNELEHRLLAQLALTASGGPSDCGRSMATESQGAGGGSGGENPEPQKCKIAKMGFQNMKK